MSTLESVSADSLAVTAAAHGDAVCHAVQAIQLRETWTPAAATRSLLVFTAAGTSARVIAEANNRARALAADIAAGAEPRLAELAAELRVPVLDPAAPLPLVPVRIGKPWGEEIWFTGMEARGVAGVGSAEAWIPLPWLLAAAPEIFGDAAVPLLAKVLAPLPVPELGDLYFEVHARKRELYLVTGVDADCWPSGLGGVRLGMDPEARARLGDAGLRTAFLNRAARYAKARSALTAAQSDPQGPADQGGRNSTDRHAAQAAADARADLDRLIHIRTLAVGDVVEVAPGMPHGLLHGVRVLEIQTPVYERRILYASQALATQADWDTREAVSAMTTAPALTPRALPLAGDQTGDQNSVGAEWIADTPEFRVLRLQLPRGRTATLPTAAQGLLIGIEGRIACGALSLGPETAALLGREALALGVRGTAASSTCLLALPGEPS